MIGYLNSSRAEWGVEEVVKERCDVRQVEIASTENLDKSKSNKNKSKNGEGKENKEKKEKFILISLQNFSYLSGPPLQKNTSEKDHDTTYAAHTQAYTHTHTHAHMSAFICD